MKLRDLDIAHKLATQSPEFLAARVARLLQASTPQEYIDEQSIVIRLEAGISPTQIVNEVTQTTWSSHGKSRV